MYVIVQRFMYTQFCDEMIHYSKLKTQSHETELCQRGPNRNLYDDYASCTDDRYFQLTPLHKAHIKRRLNHLWK